MLLNKQGISEIAIAGGVSANSGLRKVLQEKGRQKDWSVYVPKIEYCTDNAAMIAVTAYHKYLKQEFVGQEDYAMARLKF